MAGTDTQSARSRLRLALYQGSNELGGAEMSAGNLLEALHPDIDVTVIGSNRDVVDWVAERRPGTERLIVARIESHRHLRSMFRFRHVIAQLRPHVIQFNLPWAYDARWETLVASTVRGVSVVVVEQSPFPLPTMRSRLLKRVVGHMIEAHVAVSKAVADGLQSSAGRGDDIRVIFNGVPDAATPARNAHSPPVLGTIARLDPMKGLDVILRALASLPDVRLIVVGTGPEEEGLRALAASLGVDNRVDWAGWSDQPRAHLGDFDVFVLASRMEGFGMVLCEAMLARLPVVASRVGGIPEVVVDEATGLLVPPDDPSELAGAIARLLADPELRARMGDAGWLRAKEHFTAAAMARAYEALYDELTATRRTTSATKPRTTSVE